METQTQKPGCLRREYLDNKEAPSTPLMTCISHVKKGGFFVDGHRLSSLYRRNKQTTLWLITRYAASLLPKYSNNSLSKGS